LSGRREGAPGESELVPPREQHSLATTLLLHLLPGSLAVVAYVLLAGPVNTLGFPPLAALLLAIAFVIVPFELGLLLIVGSRRNGTTSLEGVVLYRDPVSRQTWLWLVPVLLVAAVVASGLLAAVEPAIQAAFFAWLPDWFLAPVDLAAVSSYSMSSWMITLGAYFTLNAFIGPAVEELYFRGYLLPRIERFGRWAPLLNTVLFSLYHFWSPWQFLSRIAASAPFVYAVWWKRSVYLGMVVHVLLNLLGVIFVATFVLSQL
jgi:uncharacterized protein